MDNTINKIQVGGTDYGLTIPAGLTDEQQAQIRQNIGAISASEADVVSNGTYPEMTVGEATHAQNADDSINAANAANAQTAAQATKLQTPRAIDGMEFDGTAQIIHYGFCSTGADVDEKAVSLAGFTLVTGARITVNFTMPNTVGSPTLNVNGTGAVALKCKNRTTGLLWQAEIMTLVYDGTNWCIIGGYSLADKPVNSHHIQYEGEDAPAALFGGKWDIDTDYAGRVLVGQGTGYPLGETGGAVTHKLTVLEIPPHSHKINGQIYDVQNGSALQTIRLDYEVNQNLDTVIQNTGEGQSFSIMQPYKVVGVWKRTS